MDTNETSGTENRRYFRLIVTDSMGSPVGARHVFYDGPEEGDILSKCVQKPTCASVYPHEELDRGTCLKEFADETNRYRKLSGEEPNEFEPSELEKELEPLNHYFDIAEQ